MRKVHSLTIVIFCILLHSIISCNNDGNISQDEYTIARYKKAQLNNIYDNEILPLHQSFISEILLLSSKATSFTNEINSDNLASLKLQWKAVSSIWKKCELYDIGTVKDSFIHYSINSWPANVSFIEANIVSSTTINEEYISNIGFSSKGIAGIEYLLFNTDETTTINNFQSSSARLAYLNACIADLHTNSNTLLTLWNSYQNEFVTTIQNGISGSQNQVINSMVKLLEEIIISKLNNAINLSDVSQFEAYRSDYSLNLIKDNIITLQRCYTGDFKATPLRVGFKNYLIELGNDNLSLEIDEKFNSVISRINTMDSSLNTSLTNTPEIINELKNELEELLFLIKIEMSQAIGSTITFNSNDGD